jgi:hypothetical protein
VTRQTDVHKLGTKLDIDPMELLKMINGKVVPTQVDRVRVGAGVRMRSGLPAEAGRRNQTVNHRAANKNRERSRVGTPAPVLVRLS